MAVHRRVSRRRKRAEVRRLLGPTVSGRRRAAAADFRTSRDVASADDVIAVGRQHARQAVDVSHRGLVVGGTVEYIRFGVDAATVGAVAGRRPTVARRRARCAV